MRRALGKGLSQLIAEEVEATPNEAALTDIIPNRGQPRTIFEDGPLQDLAASIKVYGILQPLAVRPTADGKYELIAGERRFRAAKMAGLKSVPIVVRAANNSESLELALVENIQREDISPMECARAYRRLIDEFGMTQEKVADKVGKARASVANSVRLLKLPLRIQKGLEDSMITEGHARALLGLSSEAQMLAVYDQIVSRGLTVRDVEKATQDKGAKAPKSEKPSRIQKSVEDTSLEEALSVHFGSPVKLARSETGGQLNVAFYSDDDLQRILDVLGITL